MQPQRLLPKESSQRSPESGETLACHPTLLMKLFGHTFSQEELTVGFQITQSMTIFRYLEKAVAL